VLNPALIMRGEPMEIAVVVITAFIGITFIAAALEGYLAGIGKLGEGALQLPCRLIMFAAGICMALPGGDSIGLSHVQLSGLGLGLAIIATLIARIGRKPAT
jgi:TRAP-type uncharacterized transport system fused permease subunit